MVLQINFTMQIYELILQFRKPNMYGIRLPLNFRHNTTRVYLFKKDERALLFVWNHICWHVESIKRKPRELNDEVIIDLLSYKLTPEICNVESRNLRRYLKELEAHNLVIKYNHSWLVNPWYCNNLSQGQKEYLLKHLQSEVDIE